MAVFDSLSPLLGALFSRRIPVAPLPPCNPGELPVLRPGFYALEGDGLPLEGPLFLSPQECVDVDRRGTISRTFAGLRGAFLPDGRIVSVLTPRGVVHEARRRDEAYAFRLNGVTGGSIELCFAGGTGRLSFLGPGLPGGGATVLPLAHRGAHCLTPPPVNPDGRFPSNTMGAFEDALASGYPGFEADVRISADGEFVVSHDRRLKVATDGRGKIEESAWSAMERLTVRGTPVIPERCFSLLPSYFTASLSRLRDVLERFLPDPRLVRMVVDVKPDRESRIGEAGRRALQGFSAAETAKVIFLCELPGALERLKAAVPAARFALEGRRGTEPLRQLGRFIPEAEGRARGPQDAVSLNLGLPLSRPCPPLKKIRRVLEAAARHGYLVVGWTVTRESELDFLRREQLRPDLLLSDLPYAPHALQQLKG